MKTFPSFRNKHPRASRGQALVLLAVAFLVLLAFVGLTTDVGMLFIYMGHLRRAVDAASLAAAAQYREARTHAEMSSAAEQVIELNGVDPETYTITVETCETNPSDTILCTTPRRKMVRVIGELESPTSFLSLVGVDAITISAEAVSEAASLDVVLVIDISESMAWDASPGNPMRDPAECNGDDLGGTDGFRGSCQPFQEVKRAAINFTNRILNKPADQEEDRLQIVTFANGWSPNPDQGTTYRFWDTSVSPAIPRWTSDSVEAITQIQNLKVYQPGACFDPRTAWMDPLMYGGTVDTFYGPCRIYYPDDSYHGLDCLACSASIPGVLPETYQDYSGTDWEWSSRSTTNIGGGLLRAGNMFSYGTREDALWVVVLLTDGMANATDREPEDQIDDFSTYPIGFCPDSRVPAGQVPVWPDCQDENVTTRHGDGDLDYDADDYARDMADFVGCLAINPGASCNGIEGQGAIIFSIGLGNIVLDSVNEADDRPYGASLLRYIAERGYDGDTSNSEPCDSAADWTDWCGNYYFAPEGPQLSRIFEDIASRIFTRLTH